MAPNTIILDTYGMMSELRALAKDYREIPEAADDLAQELLERIHWRRYAELNVKNLALQIRMHDFVHLREELDEIFAKPVQQLGLSIIEQLDRIGAYDINGFLHYHLHVPHKKGYQDDLMLTQTCAIPYFKGDHP